jgi:hypothetical protein
MKMLFVLFISLLPLISIGQKLKDSIQLKDGRNFNCKISDLDEEKIFFYLSKEDKLVETFIPLSKVDYFVKKNQKTKVEGKEFQSIQESTEVDFSNEKQFFYKPKKDAGFYLVKAGKLLKGALVIPVTGNILGWGLISSNLYVEVAYAIIGGSALIGYTLAIIAFNKIISAGENL